MRTLAVVVTIGRATIASAQPQDEERAQELYRQGLSAYQEGDFERAYELFEDSLEMHAHPFTTLQLGLTAERLGQPVEAARFLEQYLLTGPENADRIRERIERIRESPSLVTVRTDPPGALIRQDDEILAGTPAHLRLRPGTHRLLITRPGYEPISQQVEVEFGETYQIELDLERAPTQLAIRHEGDPPVRVRIDGTSRGIAPQTLEVSPGAHTVELSSSGGSLDVIVPVEAGHTREITTEFVETRDYSPLRFGLGVRGGVLVSLELAGETPPVFGHVRVESYLRLPCSQTCFVLHGSVGLSPVGDTEMEGQSVLFLDGMLGGGLEMNLVGRLRLSLRSSVGLGRFTGVGELDRASWWPEQSEAVASGARFFLMTDASLVIELSDRIDLVVTPLSYRYLFADEFPGGLSSFAFMVGGSFWL